MPVIGSPTAPNASFTDNFPTNGPNNWVNFAGGWQQLNGKYYSESYNIGGVKSVATRTNFSDFTYDVNINIQNSGTQGGEIFRVSNPANGADAYNGYYAGVNTSGQVVLGKSSNAWTQLGSTPMTINVGSVYHMRVIAKGANIQVFVDDMTTPKLNVNDSTFASGSIGLRHFSSGTGDPSGTTVIFDSVAVTTGSTPPSSGTFNDSFSSGNANNWTTYGGTWAVTNGQYTVAANPGAKSMATGKTFSDLTYDADVSIGATGNAGLTFRITNPGTGPDSYTGYYAGIDAGGNVILGKSNNTWTQLATTPMAVTANTLYHLKVVAQGSTIKVYVGDMITPKINVTDTSYTSGGIGLRTYNADAKFDNVTVGTLTLSENFDNGNANNWTTYGGTWAVASGQYTVAANPGAKSIANNTNYGDFTYEGDVSLGAAGDAGLIFRVNSPTTGADTYNGYLAGLDMTGKVILGKTNGIWTPITSTNMTVTANTLYHMKIVAQGSSITVFVNDMVTPKITVTDTTYTSGSVGVRTYNADAKFDNLTVR